MFFHFSELIDVDKTAEVGDCVEFTVSQVTLVYIQFLSFQLFNVHNPVYPLFFFYLREFWNLNVFNFSIKNIYLTKISVYLVTMLFLVKFLWLKSNY